MHFSNTGNSSYYMPQARRAMAGAYSIRQRYCGLACDNMCGCCCNSSAPLSHRRPCMAAGCGVSPRAQHRSAGQRRNTRNFCCSYCAQHQHIVALLAELGHLRAYPCSNVGCTSALCRRVSIIATRSAALPAGNHKKSWLQAAVRFGNALVALPAGDFHRDGLYDSLQEAIAPFQAQSDHGFVRGLLA